MSFVVAMITSASSRVTTQSIPRVANVRLGRPLVADGEAQRIAPVEPRMREEHLPAPVRPLQELLVLLVRSLAPKAHEREVTRRHDVPAGLLAYPTLEQLGQPDRLADAHFQ